MLARAILATVTSTLTICPTSATILPLSAISSPSSSLPMTEITYYQGLSTSAETRFFAGSCDGLVVAKGELTAGYCVILQTYAVSLGRIQGMECAFRMFKGSTNCEADADEIMNVPIPSGDGDVCLVTGVEDGGKFSQGSGFLVCG